MKIELTETRDFERIDAIVRDRSVYPFIVDDDSPPADAFTTRELLAQPSNTAYLVTLEGLPAGCFIFLGNELHTCLLANCRGRQAIEAGRMALRRFEAEHPGGIESFAWQEEPRTTWYARSIGMRQYGLPSPHPHTRNGRTITRLNFRKERTCHS